MSFTDAIDGWKEGSTLFRSGEGWIVLFDIYNRDRYGAMRTNDFERWEDVTDELSVPANTRHGSVLSISNLIAGRLVDG